MLKYYLPLSLSKILFCLIFTACFYFADAQYSNATLDMQLTTANEYGTSNSNTYTSGGQTWYLTWDADTLYVLLRNASIYEGAFMYFDFDPIVPINGGNNSNGNVTGFFYENLTPNLPFRGDAFLYTRNVTAATTFGIVGRANGTGGWFGIGANANALSGITDDVADGFIASGIVAGESRREFKIAWSRLKGTAGAPASFNWLGYCAYNCGGSCGGIYGQVPSANPSGTFTVGSTPDMERYFTVSTTANGVATNPFSRDSYTHIGGSISSFGNINCYDFTMNSPGQSVTRMTGPGLKDWIINGTLVINDGSVYFGAYNAAYLPADYGTTIINDVLISGGELNFDYNMHPAIVNGNCNQTGGIFNLGDRTQINQGDLELNGNWDRTGGTFGINHKAVFFRGSSPQTISGISTTFPNVEINNPAGVTFISGDHFINDTLRLINGNLNLGNNNLVINGLNGLTASSTAAIEWNSVNSFIVTDGTGIVEQQLIGPSYRNYPVLFPIGNSTTDYRPVTITNSGTDDNFSARVFSGVWTGGYSGAGSQITSQYVDRTWVIGEGEPGGSDLDLTFQYETGDELPAFNRTNCAVVYHDGTNWVTTSAFGSVTGSNPYTRTTNSFSTTGNFSITSDLLTPLPVHLLDFNAKLIGNDGDIYWTASDESGLDYYSLERSTDGVLFKEILQKPVQPGFSFYKQYAFTDKNINGLGVDIVYYRLNQFDKNGTHKYSKIAALRLHDGSLPALTGFFPNPCNDYFTLNYFSDINETISCEILNSTGSKVRTANFAVEKGKNIIIQKEMQSFAPGLYFIKITNHIKQINYKFVKQ